MRNREYIYDKDSVGSPVLFRTAGRAHGPTLGLVDYMCCVHVKASKPRLRSADQPAPSSPSLSAALGRPRGLPSPRMPVLSLHHKGRSVTKRVSVSAFAGGPPEGLTLQLSVTSSSWTF